MEKISTFVRSRKKSGDGNAPTSSGSGGEKPTDPTSPLSIAAGATSSPFVDSENPCEPSVEVLKHATRVRKRTVLVASGFYFVSLVLLIMVEIGNTYDKPILRDLWFYKLDLENVVPLTAGPNAVLFNSIARSVGLHDFYQVGLWNFCEGYNDGTGITFCSTPQKFYWFNPVETISNELLAGASIPLPSTVNDILTLIRIASQCMWGFFLTTAILNFILIFTGPLAVYTRLYSIPLGFLSGISTLLLFAGASVATAMALAFRYALTQQDQLDIRAFVGSKMLALMWAAAVCNFVAMWIHYGLGCCCASRRDVKTGRKSLLMSRKSPHLALPHLKFLKMGHHGHGHSHAGSAQGGSVQGGTWATATAATTPGVDQEKR